MIAIESQQVNHHLQNLGVVSVFSASKFKLWNEILDSNSLNECTRSSIIVSSSEKSVEPSSCKFQSVLMWSKALFSWRMAQWIWKCRSFLFIYSSSLRKFWKGPRFLKIHRTQQFKTIQYKLLGLPENLTFNCYYSALRVFRLTQRKHLRWLDVYWIFIHLGSIRQHRSIGIVQNIVWISNFSETDQTHQNDSGSV